MSGDERDDQVRVTVTAEARAALERHGAKQGAIQNADGTSDIFLDEDMVEALKKFDDKDISAAIVLLCSGLFGRA